MNKQTVLRWVFRHRGALVTPPLLFALVYFRHEMEAPWILWPLGLFLVLLGVGFRVWAQQHLHHRLRMHMQFTTTGPYALVRNPLYIGNTLIYLGATATSELPWVIPLTVLWCLGIYSLVVRYEEAALLEQYGEAYREYLRGVPRWLPQLRRSRGWEFVNQHFRAAVLTELHCMLILLPFVLKEVVSRFLEH